MVGYIHQLGQLIRGMLRIRNAIQLRRTSKIMLISRNQIKTTLQNSGRSNEFSPLVVSFRQR